MCRSCRTLLAVSVLWGLVGCHAGGQRLNAPPQGATERPHYLQEHYVYMQDNALLADMSFGDVHFVPHTDKLNGLGARRMQRYAELLQHYGGTLRYDTELPDDDPLLASRMAHVKEYLQLAGLAPGKFEVVAGGPGGRGMRAEEAVHALQASEQGPDSKSKGAGSLLGALLGGSQSGQ